MGEIPGPSYRHHSESWRGLTRSNPMLCEGIPSWMAIEALGRTVGSYYVDNSNVLDECYNNKNVYGSVSAESSCEHGTTHPSITECILYAALVYSRNMVLPPGPGLVNGKPVCYVV